MERTDALRLQELSQQFLDALIREDEAAMAAIRAEYIPLKERQPAPGPPPPAT